MKDFDLFISDLAQLISYKSKAAAEENGAPFGAENKKALDFFLDKARQFGLKTINYDNYIGEAFIGDGEEIGIIGHLDVVPEGSGWKTPPFELTFDGENYCGRGVSDDKGPLLCCLYALKDLAASGKKINKKFRIIAGCNEETGWKDVEYFRTKSNFPEYGFSPDGDFPLSYAEKGMAIVEFYLPKFKNFSSVSGGTVINAVCGYAEMVQNTPIDDDKVKQAGLKRENDKIISVGKSCHGSRPELGKNAILPLLKYALSCGEPIENVIDCLFCDKGGLKNIVTEQGDVTFSPDLISETEENVVIKCDCRYPYPVKEERLDKIFASFGIPYKMSVKHGTQYVDKKSVMINVLLNAYNSYSDKKGEPISQCGSTFARVFEKGVAFGPEFPNKPSSIHEPNERVSKTDLIKTYEIYKKAIFDLNNTEKL